MKSSKYALCALLVASFFLSAGALRAAEPGIYMLFVWGTSDPGVRDGVEISKRKIEAAFVEDTSPYASEAEHEGYYNSAGGLVALNPYIKEKRTLEGDDASGENILKNCRELAAAAGPNDAVMVYILCHSATIKGPDGKRRHGLAPIAENARDLQLHKYGIARGSIMKAIKSKPHRLNMLITDSCSESLRVNLKECEDYAVTACVFDPYLPPFLLKAKGNLNIHASRPETSSSHGELSWGFVPFGWKEVPSDPEARHAYERYAGTVFTNAFLQLAQGLCNPDTDYTVDAFFRKLRLELDDQCWEMKYYLKWTRQFANLEHFFGQSTQTLTRYNDDSEAFPPDLEFKSKYEEAYAKENDADATSL